MGWCTESRLTYGSSVSILPYMIKRQVYFPEEEFALLQATATRSGRSVADLIREAVRRVWIRPKVEGPVALWDGQPSKSAVEHDAIYDLHE